MLIEDHINFTGKSPLTGQNDDSIGVRFPDMSRCYTPELKKIAIIAANAAGIPIRRGIYAGWNGPELETNAERRYLRNSGADAVGMSTVAEVISATHCGL
ncbi:phosphorylase family protein, partial [Aeromonas veronii]|uniref:phosphorylase family protein n=1 Tax=Aeromonas veronii TaxID=654 RepID=UPI00406CB94A